ncbi:phospholipase A2-like, partial [Clarias magur]
CVASGETMPRILWQFGQLITCTQPKVNPSIYDYYGCYCGVSGSGAPKDQIDQCCAVHDMCYDSARKLPECSAYTYQPFIKGYFFSCSAKTVTCS